MTLKRLAILTAACAAFGAPASAQEKPQFFMANPQAVFARAVQADNLLFISGAISSNRTTFADEAKGVMDSVQDVLTSRGLGWRDVVKCTVMMADMAKWDDFNKVYVTYFGDGPKPARSAFGVSGLALNAAIELECIAHISAANSRRP